MDAIHHGCGCTRKYSQKLPVGVGSRMMRLRSLVERAILALLDQLPNLMDFSWREWQAAR